MKSSALHVAGRFIPAGAGNVFVPQKNLTMRPVHPRGRGKRVSYPNTVFPGSGSSPRARETLVMRMEVVDKKRFIPAGAGNVTKYFQHCRNVAVHPRGRGKRGGNRYIVTVIFGSSPRARETFTLTVSGECFKRFIPAGAGNVNLLPSLTAVSPVHPRGRGKRHGITYTELKSRGSSPRARET